MTTRAWQLGNGRGAIDGGAWDEVAAAVEAPLRSRPPGPWRGRARPPRGRSPRERPNPPAADIIVSNDPAVAIAIQTADCVPILIADRRTGAVAAAHAGWRGLAAGVPRVAVDALVREFGSRPADLIAAAGPSIGACCYEVGEDVRRAFRGSGLARRR